MCAVPQAPSVSSLHALTHAQLAPTDNLHLSMSAATSGGLLRDSCADVLPQPHCAPLGRQVSLFSQHIPQLARILSLYLPTHSPNPPFHPFVKMKNRIPLHEENLTHLKQSHQAPVSMLLDDQWVPHHSR